MDRRLLDYSPVMEIAEFGPQEESAGAPRQASVLGTNTEMALAAELLGAGSDAVLDSFFRKLISNVGPAGAALTRSPAGKLLAAALKRIAVQNLPLSALHGGLHRPRQPRRIEQAAHVFGLELEGLSPEDKEFALAQQFIRFAAQAAKNAGMGRGDPCATARRALHHAALKHAPGLHGPSRRAPPAGRWLRQGAQIVVLDC